MMKDIKEVEEEEAEEAEAVLSADNLKKEAKTAEDLQAKKSKLLISTRSLPLNMTIINQDKSSHKISRQNSLPYRTLDLTGNGDVTKGRRPNLLIRMNSDPKMLPSIELSLSKDNEETLSFNELRKGLENGGGSLYFLIDLFIGDVIVFVSLLSTFSLLSNESQNF